MNKPYSESCDQNRDPILAVLKPLFVDCKDVLEIGSGTGQHAVYFAEKMPELTWHSSDTQENHDAIHQWLNEAALANTRSPIDLDVSRSEWPQKRFDAVFSANTAHIMHWPMVEDLFTGVGKVLRNDGLFVLYGPFNYNNQFTSDSNARFDIWLKERDPYSGVRNFEDVNQLAENAGMQLKQDYEMPANNRILCWQKLSA